MSNYLEKLSLKGKVTYVNGGAGLFGSEVSKATEEVASTVFFLSSDAA